MPIRRSLLGVVIACSLLGNGCSLLHEDRAAASAACREALTRAGQVTQARARALARTEAVTEMDPEGTVAVLVHREDAQRAISGSIARIVRRADDRAEQYRRRRDRCRSDQGQEQDGVPESCRRAFTLSSRLTRGYVEATATRLDYWSEQVAMAENAWAGRVAATRRAIDRWDRLRIAHERQVIRLDRTTARHRQAAGACRDAL